jgi:hypothetical protein
MAANGQTRGIRLFYEGVAAGQTSLKVVQTTQNPVEIAGLLVLDVALPGSLGGQVLTARVILGAPGLSLGAAALGVVLGLAGRLLGHPLGLKVFARGAGEKAKP